jgi:hypothetical protein
MVDQVLKRPRLDNVDKNFDFLSDEKVRTMNFNWSSIHMSGIQKK